MKFGKALAAVMTLVPSVVLGQVLANGAVSVTNLSVAGRAETTLREVAYVVSYAVQNTSDQVIENLSLVIVGRNDAGQIVETDPYPAVYRGSLPNGLQPSETVVLRHALRVTNPDQVVTTIEAQVERITLR
jgi:hypothetical protein